MPIPVGPMGNRPRQGTTVKKQDNVADITKTLASMRGVFGGGDRQSEEEAQRAAQEKAFQDRLAAIRAETLRITQMPPGNAAPIWTTAGSALGVPTAATAASAAQQSANVAAAPAAAQSVTNQGRRRYRVATISTAGGFGGLSIPTT